MPSLPNIVIVLTDQQRADLTAREDFGLDTTPFLDELAGRGAWFDRAYTTAPLCCPARTSLLTGRYPAAHRVRENPGVDQAVFHQDLFQVLREQGYATALIGKNHSYVTPADVDFYDPYMHGGGESEDRTPEEREFDRWLTNLRHRTPDEASPFPVELQCPSRIVSSAQRWISSLDGRPFALLLSFPEPHNPYQVPEPYFSLFPPEHLPPLRTDASALETKSVAWRFLRRLGESADRDYGTRIPRARANYLGMLRLIDDQVRRFAGFLENSGMLDDTITVATADHGDYVGEYGLQRKGSELPEVLTRIPLLFAGPGIRRQLGPRPAHVSIADIFPTICDLLGLELPAGVQGRSLWPLLAGQPHDPDEFRSAYAEQGMGGLPYEWADIGQPMPGLGRAEQHFDFDELNAVTLSGQRRMVRRGDFKIVVDNLGAGQLYHLPTDPYELENLWDRPEHAESRSSLLLELAQWMMRAEDPLPIPENGYPRKADRRNFLAPYRIEES